MKRIKVASIMTIGVVGIILCITTQAWSTAGFAPAPGDECCLVQNPGAGALAIKGTVTVTFEKILATPENYYNLDAVLRLERSGDVHFFRLNIPVDQDLEMHMNDRAILCLILNPLESLNEGVGIVARERVKGFVNGILDTIFPGVYGEPGSDLLWQNARLVITASSISNAMGVDQCDDLSVPGPDCELCNIPETNRYASEGNVTIYAVEAAKVRFVNQATCEVQE